MHKIKIFFIYIINMIELVPSTDIKKVQTYIEEKENVKLILQKQNVNEI